MEFEKESCGADEISKVPPEENSRWKNNSSSVQVPFCANFHCSAPKRTMVAYWRIMFVIIIAFLSVFLSPSSLLHLCSWVVRCTTNLIITSRTIPSRIKQFVGKGSFTTFRGTQKIFFCILFRRLSTSLGSRHSSNRFTNLFL